MDIVKYEKLWLKSHPEFNEKWVQNQIAEDPAIIGLGDLVVKDIERHQPGAGRLDILLQDPDTDRRYEVEIQLGKTDESHLIRTIEYWDIEKKRYPQYDHCAVIIAEDITSRFLNVINLFNGHIPIIAIQMSALKLNESVGLVFTTVVDELTLGMDEGEEEAEATDRSYWENKRANAKTVMLADTLLGLIHTFAPSVQLKYNKFYIGLAENGTPNNFTSFKPRKSYIIAEIRLKQSAQIQTMLDDSELDVMDYKSRSGRYRIRLSKRDIDVHSELITNLMQMAYGE